MPGEPDPLYAKAREILLDALEALGSHRSSLVLVGAQAIYLHTGKADIAVAPFTTDADVIIDPDGLSDHPIIGDALQAAGFLLGDQPGQWLKNDARVDLMVPEAVAGAGSRGARLGPHGNRAARKARGLEGALVDQEMREIVSFQEGGRRFEILVAGPAALLVSKLHKLAERIEEPSRPPVRLWHRNSLAPSQPSDQPRPVVRALKTSECLMPESIYAEMAIASACTPASPLDDQQGNIRRQITPPASVSGCEATARWLLRFLGIALHEPLTL